MNVEQLLKAIGIYSIFLMIFGTIGNAFGIFICLKRELRTVPTFIFYIFLLISDTISLFWWNMDHYLLVYKNYQLEDLGVHACRTVTFFQLFSFQWSSWLLVTMTIERYLSVKIKQWRFSIYKVEKAICISILIGIIIVIVNTCFAVRVTFSDNDYNKSNMSCFGADDYSNWMLENNYVYSFVPFVIMIIVNVLLVLEIKSSKARVHDSCVVKIRRSAATNLTVIVTTTLFVILTAPDAIANAFFVSTLFQTRLGIAILFSCDSLVFTFNSTNFIFLYFSNKKYSHEVNCLISKLTHNNQHAGDTRTTLYKRNNIPPRKVYT